MILKTKKIIIKRTTPKLVNRKRYSLKEIAEAARMVREAVRREEEKYGKPSFT